MSSPTKFKKEVKMFTLLAIVLYTILVLFFVPLEKIGQYQTSVKKNIQKLIDKINDK